jgi:ADP-ribose pyrophosphatase YjhB (NUDIX family)
LAIKHIVKAGEVNAVMRQLAEQDLHRTQAAVQARQKRQKPDQHHVNKGGLITAKEGKLRVRDRDKKEAALEARRAARKILKERKQAAEHERAEAEAQKVQAEAS